MARSLSSDFGHPFPATVRKLPCAISGHVRFLRYPFRTKIHVSRLFLSSGLHQPADHRNQIQEIEAAGFRVEPHRVISETISGSVAVSARPAGKMTMNVINAVAQFERDLLIERTNAGLRRARSEGTKLGRPALTSSQRAEIISALEDGQKVAPLAKRFDVSRQTIMRIRDLVHGGADAGKTLGRGDTRAVGTLQTMPDELFEKAKAELARYDLESEDERIDELPTRHADT